jgi:hypothetical protein
VRARGLTTITVNILYHFTLLLLLLLNGAKHA